MILLILVLIVVAYLLGSIPSAVWIGKWFYGVDVRDHGSHNAGATNVLRVLGRRAALPVFIIDGAKGYGAVLLSYCTDFDGEAQFYLRMALTVAVILGHIFPIFAGFRGGKGVATITGCMFGIAPIAVLLCLITFIVTLFFSHYVSLGSMVAGCCFPFYIYMSDGWSSPSKIIFGVVVAILLVITHRKNIKRLREGSESKTYLFIKRPEQKS